MAYENDVISELEHIENEHLLDFGDEINELKEVYRKAKAFDQVIELVKTEFVSEDLADGIRTLVYDYEYDKEDK